MELAHFLSLIQYEVLKSFDFSGQMQSELNQETNSEIQLALEAVDVEIPLIFDTAQKKINIKDIPAKSSGIASVGITQIDVPFTRDIQKTMQSAGALNLASVPKKTAKRAKAKAPKDTVLGDVVNVSVANPASKRDESFDPNLIGKIRLVIKPVIK